MFVFNQKVNKNSREEEMSTESALIDTTDDSLDFFPLFVFHSLTF